MTVQSGFCTVGFPSPDYFACLNVKIQDVAWGKAVLSEDRLVSEWEVERARLPGPRLGEGSRQLRSQVVGMRRRWQSSCSGRRDGEETKRIEPREELRALQCFTEV